MKINKKFLYAALATVMIVSGGCSGADKTDSINETTQVNETSLANETSAAQESAAKETLPGVSIDVNQAEAVSIYYGSVCYSFFSEDKKELQGIADLFHGFSLEEAVDKALDPDTTYQVYFTTDDTQVAAINVDENKIFYLPSDQKYYQVAEGEFRFDLLDKLYKESMNADGFDANQCLIR